MEILLPVLYSTGMVMLVTCGVCVVLRVIGYLWVQMSYKVRINRNKKKCTCCVQCDHHGNELKD